MNYLKHLNQLLAKEAKLRQEIAQIRACERSQRIARALSVMKRRRQSNLERWQQVMLLRDDGKTFVEIGRELNVTAGRAQQLYEAAMRSKESSPNPATPVTDKTSVFELGFSSRVHQCMTNAGITTVAELVDRSENQLRKYRNFGDVSVWEVKEVLGRHGFSLSTH